MSICSSFSDFCAAVFSRLSPIVLILRNSLSQAFSFSWYTRNITCSLCSIVCRRCLSSRSLSLSTVSISDTVVDSEGEGVKSTRLADPSDAAHRLLSLANDLELKSIIYLIIILSTIILLNISNIKHSSMEYFISVKHNLSGIYRTRANKSVLLNKKHYKC